MPELSTPLTFEPIGCCPLCGESSRQKMLAIHGTGLHECAACSFRYLDPCLTSESMASIYESSENLSERCSVHRSYYEYGDLKTPTKTLQDYKKGLQLLEDKSQNSKSVFEAGFGGGLFLALAQQEGWKVAGIDTSSQNKELAKEKFGLDLQQGDFSIASVPNGNYQAAAAWDVLEHQKQPNDFLKNMFQILTPGGKLLIAVPNDRSFLGMLSLFLYKISGGLLKQGVERIYVLEHIGYYNASTLQRILKKNGFDYESHFFTNTDLDRYHFSPFEKFTAGVILMLGKLLGLQNRIVMIARKPS